MARPTTYRRWISQQLDIPVNEVPPGKLVYPEITIYGRTEAPRAVEVHRTYERLFKDLLRRIGSRATSRVVDLMQIGFDGRQAQFEQWSAAHFEPFERPTLFYFRDAEGRRRGRSSVLYVTADVHITTTDPGLRVPLPDPTGVGSGLQLEVGAERTVTVGVRAPVDPVVELGVLTPSIDFRGFSLSSYVKSLLELIEAELAEEPGSGLRQGGLTSSFEETYGSLFTDDAAIDFSLDRTELTVGPDNPARVKVSFRGQRRGRTMLAFVARIQDGEGERYSISELLPVEVSDDRPFEMIRTRSASTRKKAVRKKAQSPPRGVVRW